MSCHQISSTQSEDCVGSGSSVLVAYLLMALSGATVGILLGGHISASIALFSGLVAGCVIGWFGGWFARGAVR